MKTTQATPAVLYCGIIATAIILLQRLACGAAVPGAPVYWTDFATDPGWTTTNPSGYYWNPGPDNYTLTMVDSSQGYATIPVAFNPRASFRFEFDVNVSRMDWAGNISFGLFGPTRNAFNESDVQSRIKINFGKGDLGHGLGVWAYDGSGVRRALNQYPSSYQLNTWYHAAVTFNHEAEMMSVEVTRISDKKVIWSASLPGVQGFTNLVYFGASIVGNSYHPGATAIATIENVGLCEFTPTPTIRWAHVEICWPSRTNAHYAVDYCTNPAAPDWINLRSNLPGNAGQTCVQDATAVWQPKRFYRIRVSE